MRVEGQDSTSDVRPSMTHRSIGTACRPVSGMASESSNTALTTSCRVATTRRTSARTRWAVRSSGTRPARISRFRRKAYRTKTEDLPYSIIRTTGRLGIRHISLLSVCTALPLNATRTRCEDATTKPTTRVFIGTLDFMASSVRQRLGLEDPRALRIRACSISIRHRLSFRRSARWSPRIMLPLLISRCDTTNTTRENNLIGPIFLLGIQTTALTGRIFYVANAVGGAPVFKTTKSLGIQIDIDGTTHDLYLIALDTPRQDVVYYKYFEPLWYKIQPVSGSVGSVYILDEWVTIHKPN